MTEQSKVSRVRHGVRDTEATLISSDSFAAYSAVDGALVVELHRFTASGKTLETFRFTFSAEDAEHLHRETADWRRSRVVGHKQETICRNCGDTISPNPSVAFCGTCLEMGAGEAATSGEPSACQFEMLKAALL